MLALLIIAAISANAAPLSLRESAAYALRHSPALDTSQRSLLIASLNAKNAGAAFLPSLDFTSQHGLQRFYPQAGASEPWASTLSLAVTETLYDNGESITRRRSADFAEELSRLALEKDRDRLLLGVANAFFAHSQARRNLETQQEQHAVLKLQVELVKDAYTQGVKTRKDYLRFLTQLNRSDISLLATRDAVTKTEIDLRRLLGVPLGSGEKLEFTVDTAPPGRVAPGSYRIENHRDFRIADLQHRISELTVDLAHRKQLPQLGVTAGATYGSSGYLFTGVPAWENDKLGWNALVTLSWNLFDFGTRRRNTEIAAQQASIKANELTLGLFDLRQEIDKLQIDLRQLAESYRLSEELFKLERANLALITNEYRQGKVQYLDYINSLENFANAKTTYYSSLYELRKGLLAERYHEGTLYETILGL